MNKLIITEETLSDFYTLDLNKLSEIADKNENFKKAKVLFNRVNMIKLCQNMIKFHSDNKSVFADINKNIWESKLEYWIALCQNS